MHPSASALVCFHAVSPRLTTTSKPDLVPLSGTAQLRDLCIEGGSVSYHSLG